MSTRRLVLAIIIGIITYTVGIAAQEVPPTPSGPFQLPAGIPVEGNLNESSPVDTFAFDAPEGAEITLTMAATSGDLDPLLILFDDEQRQIDRNDDRETGVRDAQITLTVPAAGTYTLQATRFGDASGTYRLTLDIAGLEVGDGGGDTLSATPPFSVGNTELDLSAPSTSFGTGTLSEDNPRAYFSLVGEQGDLLQSILTITGDSDLTAEVTLRSASLSAISQTLQLPSGELLAYAILPERNWYLVEVSWQAGSGPFTLFVDSITGQFVDYSEDLIAGEFIPNQPGTAYIFNGTLGDQLIASTIMVQDENADEDTPQASPEIRLLDIQQRELEVSSGEGFALLATELPRSGTYILQVNNLRPGASGRYNLSLNADENGISKKDVTEAFYNQPPYKGTITQDDNQDLYRFEGKAGELVTVEMTAVNGTLDPFVAIMDADLNELIVNDNARGSRNARTAPFALPADGTYYILASRSDVALGTTAGEYDLSLSAGAIQLEPGQLTATLTWNGDEDLNLFFREFTGRIISWSNPTPEDGGTLQVDSNTNCETISAQPVEHLYWTQDVFPVDEDYDLWVWYQSACGRGDPVDFTLTLSQIQAGETVVLLEQQATLIPGERFEVAIRVSDPNVFILEEGRTTLPSPQQRASEGGDVPLLMGQTIIDSIDDEVYARFYQFSGVEGETVEIAVDAITGNLDPVLIVRDDNEENLIPPVDDNSEDDRNATTTVTLPSDGRFVIAVTRFGVRDGLTTGDYSLSLRRVTGE